MKASHLKRLGRRFGPSIINLIAALINLAIRVANYYAHQKFRNPLRTQARQACIRAN